MAMMQDMHSGENSNNAPTLLGVRSPSPMTVDTFKKRRPAPTALAFSDDPLDLENAEVCIKNTFLEPKDRLSPSLGDFYSVRIVQTCPSVQIGRLSSWLESPVASSAGDKTPLIPPTPPSTQGPDFSADEHILDDDLLEAAADHHTINIFNSTGDSLFSDGGASWLPERGQQHLSQPVPPGPVCREGSVAAADLGTWCFSVPAEDDYGFPSAVIAGPLSTYPTNPEFGFADSDPKTTLNLSDMLSAEQQKQLLLSSEAMSSPGLAASAGPDLHVNPPPVYSPSGLHLQGGSSLLGVDMDGYPKPPAWTPTVSPAVSLTGAEEAGSKEHQNGRCKPCAFQHTKGCTNGSACSFCHLCGPEELKRRRKQKIEQRRIAKKTNKEDKQRLSKGTANDMAAVRGVEVKYASADLMLGMEHM